MNPEANKNNVIDKNRSQDHALDFNFLRTKGIELIQKFSGKNWTDFNLHDPGLTILEYLCYAITDVGYRTTFPITDILADKYGEISREKNFFLSREDALSSAPVTVNDYRKLLTDQIPEVDNVWMEPITTPFSALYSKGVYRVIIKPNAGFLQQAAEKNDPASDLYLTDANTKELIGKVSALLHNNRNLGDHYESFSVLQPQPIYLKANIVIEKSAAAETVMAAIYETLEQVLNPPVSFYTEAELLARDVAIEDIYSGPLLRKGIIPDSELKARAKTLDPFVLIKAISAIKEVISIKDLLISTDQLHYQTEMLTIAEPYFPVLDMDEQFPAITLYHDNYPLHIQRQEVLKKEQEIKRKLYSTAAPQQQKVPLKGDYKNLEDYVSIQTLFPAIYGISEAAGSSRLPAATQAKSRQLKAYLLFFEQILANSLAQLAHISELFSTDIFLPAAASYHFQPVYHVPDVKHILKAFTDESQTASHSDWESFKKNPHNAYSRSVSKMMETDEQYKERKKRAFDHILSRFNIAVDKHPVLLFEFYYDLGNSGRRTDLEIKWKAAILQHLNAFTGDRNKADNYLTINEDEGLESGFGKKMALLLYIQNVSRRKLSTVMEQYSNRLTISPAQEGESAEEINTLKWGAEELSILTSLEDEEIIRENQEPLDAHVNFKRQPALLFQSAMVMKNYRIMPYPAGGKQETALLFKHPRDTEWTRISRHQDEYAAISALRKTIQAFKEMSIESEGFYLLEHLLLKPPFEAPAFGFNFVDQKERVLFRQLKWLTFADRERVIAELLELSALYSLANHEPIVNRLQELGIFTNTPKEVYRLMNNLKQFLPDNTNFYPAFNYTVKTVTEEEVPEDFYNFRMTVVLPSWPARFQDKSFRELAENLFQEEGPAHLKISFLWLPLSQMKRFDELYFNWLEALKTGTDSERTRQLAQQLTRFLRDQ